MTVLLTGGSGFVGAAIAARLLDARQQVRLAQRTAPSPTLAARGVEHAMIGDLAEPISWGQALEGVETVIHVAGLAHQPWGVADAAMFKVNTDATANLANAAVTSGVRRFIFISSIRAIVGPSSPDIVTDDSIPQPIDDYGRSKLQAEQAVIETGLAGAILRPVLVIGRGAAGNLALLQKLAALPLPLPIAGLTGRRSLISDHSLASAVTHFMAIEPLPMTSYLAAHPDAMSVGEIVAALRRAQGRSAGIFRVPSMILENAARLVRRADMLERVAGDLVIRADRLSALGWKPAETTRQALARLS